MLQFSPMQEYANHFHSFCVEFRDAVYWWLHLFGGGIYIWATHTHRIFETLAWTLPRPFVESAPGRNA